MGQVRFGSRSTALPTGYGSEVVNERESDLRVFVATSYRRCPSIVIGRVLGEVSA